MSVTTSYRGRGIFADLRLVPVNGRRMVMRADVEALDSELETRDGSVSHLRRAR